MKKYILTSILLYLYCISWSAFSAVILQKTRVIIEPDCKEAELVLDAQKNVSSLVQSWVTGPDESVASHFTITPAMSLLKAGQSQSLRLIYQGEGAPKDRESLLYINIQDSVAVSDDMQGKNAINSSFLQVIKGFYRPKSLPLEGAAAAPLALKWEVKRQGTNKFMLKLTNPTPYHVVFSGISLVGGKKKLDEKPHSFVDTKFDYIKPYSISEIKLSGEYEINKAEKVVYIIVNDYGMAEAYIAEIKEGKSTKIKRIIRDKK